MKRKTSVLTPQQKLESLQERSAGLLLNMKKRQLDADKLADALARAKADVRDYVCEMAELGQQVSELTG